MPKPVARNKPAVLSIKDAAARYLALHTDWHADEYRLEESGLSADGRHLVVWAIHADDEKKPRPGGGKSVSLYMEPRIHRIVKMLHFQ